jgi:hypothetical protein
VCTSLRQLSLCYCVKLSDQAFYSLSSIPLPYLCAIDFSYLRITDSTLRLVLQSCPSISAISLCWCNNLTSSGVDGILGLSSLVKLDLTGCSGCSALSFCARNSTLQWLSVSFTAFNSVQVRALVLWLFSLFLLVCMFFVDFLLTAHVLSYSHSRASRLPMI